MLKQISSKTKNLVGWIPVQWLNNFFKEKKYMYFYIFKSRISSSVAFELT